MTIEEKVCVTKRRVWAVSSGVMTRRVKGQLTIEDRVGNRGANREICQWIRRV